MDTSFGGNIDGGREPFVLERGYSRTERSFEATGFTPLLVNFERKTAKPNAGGAWKNCVAWKVKLAVHYVIHTDKVTTDYSKGHGDEPQQLESCPIREVAQYFHRLHRNF